MFIVLLGYSQTLKVYLIRYPYSITFISKLFSRIFIYYVSLHAPHIGFSKQ